MENYKIPSKTYTTNKLGCTQSQMFQSCCKNYKIHVQIPNLKFKKNAKLVKSICVSPATQHKNKNQMHHNRIIIERAMITKANMYDNN